MDGSFPDLTAAKTNTLTPTEDAVASDFAERYAHKFVYDHTAQAWFIWDGRWKRDLRSAVFHAARLFCRETAETLKSAPTSIAKIAFASAVERAARSDPKLAVSHEIWDTDPWLLGTPQGVIDLRAGLLRPATSGLYISKYTSVAPAPSGTPAPLWQWFLDDATQHDRDLQAFLHRMCGYFLTGDVSEEMLAFFYGPGGNGKGVFLSVLTGILAEYAVSVPIEVFTVNSRINLEYYRAQMAGARLVTASETEVQAAWAESQIKEMTGNETPLSARQPYGKPFTFWPQFKISLVGNYAPKLKGRSAAMERRLRVVPFTNRPTNEDPDLKKKLQAEYPAILRQMIDGCLEWQRDRLGTTQAIKVATAAYFEQQDAFGRWLDERCKLDRSLSVKPGLLLANFNAWAKENGEDVVGNNAFAELLDRTPGLTRTRANGVRLVKGIGLHSTGSAVSDD
jgi:putative DNA primase/helicase